jgi:hypothetical protein
VKRLVVLLDAPQARPDEIDRRHGAAPDARDRLGHRQVGEVSRLCPDRRPTAAENCGTCQRQELPSVCEESRRYGKIEDAIRLALKPGRRRRQRVARLPRHQSGVTCGVGASIDRDLDGGSTTNGTPVR